MGDGTWLACGPRGAAEQGADSLFSARYARAAVARVHAAAVAVRVFVLLNAFGGKTGSIIVERASFVVASEL